MRNIGKYILILFNNILYNTYHVYLKTEKSAMIMQVWCGSEICVEGGGKPNFPDIVQQSHSSSKNLGHKIGGRWGGGRPPPLEPHL